VKNTQKKLQFNDWLRQSLRFVRLRPWVWLGYCLFVGLILVVGKISLALGVFSAVTCLLVGVGVAKYIDMQCFSANPVGFYRAIHKSLPLAILGAACIVACWFVFMLTASLLSGEYYKIGEFFFNWELTPQNLRREPLREVASWLYAYANVTLIFTLLMLATFAGWFSHALMLFQGRRWSEAKAQSGRAVAKNQSAIYKMLGFIFAEAILCTTVTPLLTPILYMLVSTTMYVSYKNLFEEAEAED
jgi:hypothetical protein